LRLIALIWALQMSAYGAMIDSLDGGSIIHKASKNAPKTDPVNKSLQTWSPAVHDGMSFPDWHLPLPRQLALFVPFDYSTKTSLIYSSGTDQTGPSSIKS
jgi:hypothetical protein